MATSLNDIAIRMSVDAESVEAGFRQARNAAVDFTRYLQKQQDDQVRAYTDSFARTQLAFNAHINDYKNALERQVAAEKEAQDQVNKIRSNNFMYNVKYGDPYDNPADRAARRKAMASRQANDQAVMKENAALQQEATALLQKHMTVNERYLAQMKRLEVLKHTYNIQTGQMLLTDDQFARMKTNLIVQTIRQQQAQVRLNTAMAGGFGGMAGAAAQASYAVEDFIQVLSMGGGLNMAMMSASNNLSMVARSMFGLSSTMGLVAGSVLPLAIIGTASLISYLIREEDQVDAVTKAYERLREEMNNRSEALDLANKFERERLEIYRQTSLQEAESKLTDLEDRRVELLREETNLLRDQAALVRQNKEMMFTVNDQEMIVKLSDVLTKFKALNPAGDNAALRDAERVVELYKKLNVELGNNAAPERIKELAESITSLIKSSGLENWTDQNGNRMFLGLGSNLESITQAEGFEAYKKSVIEFQKEQNKNESELLNVQERIAEEQKNIADFKERAARQLESEIILQREAHKMQQDEMMFMLRATDAQKELFRIQKEQQQFAGAFPGFMGGDILGNAMEAAFAQQQEQDRIAFLIAQRDALLKQQESKLGQSPVQGSLVQNAFDAQADAFKQIFEAASKRPDPQVEKTNELLRKIQEAIQNGGVIKVVP